MGNPFVRRCFCLLGLVAAISSLASQPILAQATVTGTITEGGNGQPISGAQVHFPGLQLGTLSNVQGRYLLLNVPAGSREIRAELIGRQTVTQTVDVPASGTVQVNFSLESRAISLEGVVVTGVAGATPRAQLAFTVEQVKVGTGTVSAALNAGSMIQGRMAGAKVIQGVGQPGEPPSIQLRGPTSITGSQAPLLIVDGVISRGSIADIDPNDIETIEVVKGAAAASLYGSRAQAGVIEIITKRGSSLATNSTQFTLRNTFQKNSIEYVQPSALRHEFRMTPDGTQFVDRNGKPIILPEVISAFMLDDGAGGTDPWRSFKDKRFPAALFKGNPYQQVATPGNAYSSYISIAGNEGNTQYRVSGNYQRDEGALAFHDGVKQTNVRANLDQRIGDDLSFAFSFYVSNMTQDVSITTDSRGTIFESIRNHRASADYLARDPNGRLALIADPVGRSINPLYALWWEDRTRETQRVMMAVDGNYTPTSWLTFSGNFSYDRDDNTEQWFDPAGRPRIDQPDATGSLSIDEGLRRDSNASLTASLAHSFGDLTTRTRFRWLVEDQFNSSHSARNTGFAVVGVPRMALLTGSPTLDSNEQSVGSEGFFAITALTWRERYVLDLLARRDGSSLFGADERWQNYYRVALAWRMAEEGWWPFDAITEFKPRYSRGTAGGRPGFAYQYQTYAVEQGRITPRVLGNSKLKPELSTEQEFGLDAIIADRLRVQANYVRSVVDDQLLQVPMSSLLGFDSQWQNAGTVASQTMELTLETAFVERPNFLWTGRLALDRTRQKITKLNVPPFEIVNRRHATANHNRILIAEGEALGTFYAMDWADNCSDLPAGTDCSKFQVNDDGLFVYVGAGNRYTEGISKKLWGTVGTDNGRTYLWGIPIRGTNLFAKSGVAQPAVSASFLQDAVWGNFGITMLWGGEWGADIYNQSRQWALQGGHGSTDQRNKPDELKKPVGYYGGGSLYAGNLRGDWFVEKADFIKLRELSVRYTVNRDAIPGFLPVNRATINLVGRNLKTLTGYSGSDPEVGLATFGGSASVGRVDEFFYPNYRSYGLDVELVF